MLKIYTRIIFALLLPFTFFSFWGCTIINPAEQVPTYIHIDSFHFDGNESNDIKYIWVYYNNNPVGAFDLPATVPIMTSGSGTLQIAPGIPVDGRSERPVAYPFYRIYTTTLEEQPGKIKNIVPTTGYFDSVRTTYISQFEGGITKFAKYNGTTSLITVSADSLKYAGTGSGAVYLNSPADSSEDSTKIGFPVGYGAAFIEFDCRSTIPFALGLTGTLSTLATTPIEYLAGASAVDTWHKYYFNITSFVTKYPGGTYHLYIKTSLPAGQANGRMLIDNIKLVTF